LSRQAAYLQEKFPKAEIVQDCGSGLNFKRKGLNSLLDRAIAGEKLTVVVAHRDRLCRFGFDLIRFVIERSGGKIVVLDNEEGSANTPEKELVDDLLSVVHVFSCRINGRRSYKNKNKKEQVEADSATEALVQELDRVRTFCVQQDNRAPEHSGDIC
jgi:predicted site-specific integrase-resolvase